jgi:hypothetical protein
MFAWKGCWLFIKKFGATDIGNKVLVGCSMELVIAAALKAGWFI